VFITHSIVKYSDNLGPISHIIVAAITCHLRVVKLPRVSVAVAERCHGLPLKEAKSKLSLKDTIRIVEDTKAMHFTPLEFSLIV